MTWSTTVQNVTKTQQHILRLLHHVPEATTVALAEVCKCGVRPMREHLDRLRKQGMITFQRKKNVGCWRATEDGLAFLMWQDAKEIAKDPRHVGVMGALYYKIGGVPGRAKTNKLKPDVVAKRRKIVSLIKSKGKLTAGEIFKTVAKSNKGDLDMLISHQRIYCTRGSGNTPAQYYPGQKQEAEQ